ncbi:hypothetical protein A7P96_07490 [Eikenella sp. NML03-A-027]|uniref:hypothetical protein n=1 Tax=Eikenella TaxID=538 RepID=UPI0007E1DEBC|nr:MULTISPECIES: hypothetical protein [Eikenella]OAM28835.1 hypothetical protein A7P94_02140 [Eikenella sp. NML01-A-086]OAM30428.1 hypothetical protein A7P96_07490 [Eikenella sp. NML03-A-027]OAM41041.1 hypothetical protein A7Q02_06840 [Eikenella sp. NML97-A-109]
MGGSSYRVVEVSLQQSFERLSDYNYFIGVEGRSGSVRASHPEPVFDSPGGSTVQPTANGTIQY